MSWRVAFSEQEIDLLDDWVKKGNTLVLMGRLAEWDDTRALLRQIGFNLPDTRFPYLTFLPIETEGSESIPPTPNSN